MTRILIFGTGPLLEAGVRSFSAHCLRTWHLTKPLLDAGHEVRLFTMPIYTDRPEEQVKEGIEDKSFDGFAYRAFLNCNKGFNLAELERVAAEFRPEALIAVNSGPAALMSKMAWRAPFWADLNGSVIIEAQVKARVYGTNAMLGHYWDMEEAPLRRADRFSTVSMRQLYALHGELAAVGRMNRRTFNHAFAVCIPNAYNPSYVEPPAPGKIELRGKRVPQDAFVALWCGSYNSWTDFDALLRSLEAAMERCPNLHYVSTGGPIHGHDDLTYPRFQQAVRASRFKDRIHLLGWVDAAEVPAIMATADLGLCVDANNYESVFGARNRTINMMAAGVPILTTTTAEISEEIVNAGVALGCPPDDEAAFVEKLLWAAEHRDEVRAMGAKGREYIVERFSYEKTTRDVLAWAAKPAFAPDNEFKLQRAGSSENPFLLATNPLEERADRSRAAGVVPWSNGHSFHKAGSAPLRAVQKAIGDESYEKLRFLKGPFRHEYWPRYKERQAEIAAGRRGRLQDLYLFLTNACNARCKHCFYIDELGHIPGEMMLPDYERMAPTLPPLERLTLTGGEAILHPQAREIATLLGHATKARRVTIISNGFLPAKLESFVCSMLEDSDIPGTLDVLLSVDGMEETHNTTRGNKRAWLWLNRSLEVLSEIKRANPDRFDLGTNTVITDRNWREIEELDDYLHERYACRTGFEFIRSTGFSVWGLDDDVKTDFAPPAAGLPPEDQWDNILATLRRMNRKRGIANHAFHLTARFTVEMLRTKKKIVDCVSAGQNVGVVFPTGEVAVCEFSKAFGNLKNFDFDFARAWNSPEADAMRAKTSKCHCTHGCYLSRNIEYSRAGQIAMVRHL